MYFFLLPTIFFTFSRNPFVSSNASGFVSRILLDAGITFFLVISLIFNRIFFIASDLENLLITGVNKWRLTSGIFLFIVILATPFILLFSRGLPIFFLAYNVPAPILNLETFVLFFTFIATAILSLVLGLDRSFYVVLLVSLLNFSNLAGNPLSMGNVDSSQYLQGFIASIAVAIALFVTLLLSIKKEGYAPYRLARKRRSELIKHPIDFSGLTPHKSSFKLGFALNFSSANSYSSARGPRYSRISAVGAIRVMIIFNVALSAILIFLFHTPFLSTNGAPGDFIIIYSVVISGVFIWSMVSMALAQERIWLMGSTIGGRIFLRNLVLSKSTLLWLVMLPFLIPFLAMGITGHPLFLKFGLYFTFTVVALAFPASVLGLFISGFLLPEQFVKNEMPESGTISFIIISIPMFFVVIASFISYFIPLFLLASAIVIYALAIFCLMSNSLHQRVFTSLVYRRFI